MALAAVHDLREYRAPVSAQELEQFEVDAMAGFVLARSSAGVRDRTIRGEVGHLERVREWYGRALWEMQPSDADRYFGQALREASSATRIARSGALRVYFEFLELRHKVELHAMTGRVLECPVDEMNRPRGRKEARLRIPPRAEELAGFYVRWAEDLGDCRKFAPSARNYAAAKLMSGVGLRVNETRCLDLDDVKWELGRFRQAARAPWQGSSALWSARADGAVGRGQRPRVALVHRRRLGPVRRGPRAPRRAAVSFRAKERGRLGRARRLRRAARGHPGAAAKHLPTWTGRLTPHVLRHYCASELYLSGVDLISIQEMLGHSWVATTMRYIHVHRTQIEDDWVAGQERAAERLKGLI